MKSDSLQAHGLTHTVLVLLFMTILIAGSFWILHLFLTALIWAAMIVVSTWPIMLKLQAWLWGKRPLATIVMTILLLMVLILPFSLAIGTLVARSQDIVDWVRSLAMITLPPPPDWIRSFPLVGQKIVLQWQHVMAIGPTGVSAFLTPYAGSALSWLLSLSGSVGMIIVEFLLTVFIAAIFYMSGNQVADWLNLFARRIAGHQGAQALALSAKAIQAVALGVVGTATIQAILGGLGLAICGIPATSILTALVFILCLAQLGPTPVFLPVVIFLFWTGQPGWGIGMVVWALFLGTLDNIIRPFLMKKGADLPLLLVFAGVTGGLLVFGIIGLFIGPVVLAVTYTLLDAWVTGEESSDEQPVLEQ